MRLCNQVLKIATVATVLLLVAARAGADIYDFDFRRVNDMRKAYRICKFSNYQDGECPDVWQKCHLPPLIDWDGDSKCRKPPRFTDKNDDARQALNDGHNMLEGADTRDDETERPSYGQREEEAFELDEQTTSSSEDPCALAADRQACAEALVHDAGGVLAHEADGGPISDDPQHAAQMAADTGQDVVARRVGAYISYSQNSQPITQEQLIEDNSHLDEFGNSVEYGEYEDLYGIPTLDPAPEPSEADPAQPED